MNMDWERVRAGLALLWILGCWTLAVLCVVHNQFGLCFGFVFASLALPLLLSAWDQE